MVNSMVECATSDMLIGPDWAMNIEIYDMLNHDPGPSQRLKGAEQIVAQRGKLCVISPSSGISVIDVAVVPPRILPIWLPEEFEPVFIGNFQETIGARTGWGAGKYTLILNADDKLSSSIGEALVEWQILVAIGEALLLSQSQVPLSGAECLQGHVDLLREFTKLFIESTKQEEEDQTSL
ncbi:hypothetical protein JHK86_050042 [Glycine max]|nr:hypothetical protein JHK86_050042 [Glycine max]